MACFLHDKDNVIITVPEIEDINTITYYKIFVKVGSVSWRVKHRYSEFVTLHEKLVVDHCVSKDILPPKKLIGKRDPTFVEKRRIGLEIYIVTVVGFLKETMPRILAMFLDFHKYDIQFILQEMSSYFFNEGDILLSQSKCYKFNPLELHAISKRIIEPCPTAQIFEGCYDVSHVLDFCSQLVAADVEGSWETEGASDIVPNKCEFELSFLKVLKELELRKVAVNTISEARSLRQNLKTLVVTECGLKSPVDILLCDIVHKNCDLDNLSPEKKWPMILEADFRQNLIQQLGNSLLLIPNVEKLSLSENFLTNIEDLSGLSKLSHLYLSANRIRNVDNLHQCLSSTIVHLDLSQNQICSLRGFSCLTGLQGLDLGSNIVADVTEVCHVQSLEKLTYLVLTGNPVATVVDYRIKVLGSPRILEGYASYSMSENVTVQAVKIPSLDRRRPMWYYNILEEELPVFA